MAGQAQPAPGGGVAVNDAGHVDLISEASVRAYCCDPDRLESSKDIFGWRVRDFKMLINGPRKGVREGLVKLLRFFASGNVKNENIDPIWTWPLYR